MTNPDSKLLTRSDVAKTLKVNERTIARWEAKGLLNPLRFSARCIRYRMEDVQRLIEQMAD